MKKQINMSEGSLKENEQTHSDQQLSIKSDGNRNIIEKTRNHQITNLTPLDLTKQPPLRRDNYKFEEPSESKDHSSHTENPESMSSLQERNITIQEQEEVILEFPCREEITRNYMECLLCAQMLEQESFLCIFECTHFYCKECLELYSKTCVSAFKIIKCPDGDCQKAMTEKGNEFLNFNPLIKEKYEIVKFRIEIQNNPLLVLCPNETCRKGSIAVKKGEKNGECIECNKIYCLKCKAPSHTGTCSDFEEILLKDKFRYKRCSGCNFVVERSSGCPHMTCRCGSQFCYYCARPWSQSHYCIRIAAGGDLVTDKLYNKLSCIRPKELEYEYTLVGYLSKIPTFLLCFCFMILYVSWCLVLLVGLLAGSLAISILIGYSVSMGKVYSKSKVVFVLGIILLPVAFVIGFFWFTFSTMRDGIKNYLTLALSGTLFPFCM